MSTSSLRIMGVSRVARNVGSISINNNNRQTMQLLETQQEQMRLSQDLLAREETRVKTFLRIFKLLYAMNDLLRSKKYFFSSSLKVIDLLAFK